MDIEKYSCAITLSDMEIFVFPELMMSLVLANIMSPVIWEWREEDCFKKLEGKTPYRKLLRLKQFIMDKFEFNLDLETWGLTDRKVELQRFDKYIDKETISKSNALFGYQGDKYYFSRDIRKHFGLDKYDSDIIPYWKTETVEAMVAFCHKPNYNVGAGECVSLSALYAAAMFIVCGIALEDIFMILTPLHSQNFVNIQNGILTNNRRILTKNMWFNGSELSMKARRALKNEQVTIISHISGYIHQIYKDATINPDDFKKLTRKLLPYLSCDTTIPALVSFLRYKSEYQPSFQICRDCRGKARFIKAEVLFHYEHNSKYRIADTSFDKLLDEVHSEDYHIYPFSDRIRCDDLEIFMKDKDIRKKPDREEFIKFLAPYIEDSAKFVGEFYSFVHTTPQLPKLNKNIVPTEPIKIDPAQSRDEIIEHLEKIRRKNQTADLSFYVYRDMNRAEWAPFMKAALERNPVCIERTKGLSSNEVYDWLNSIDNRSIYPDNRLAQPDEVINYNMGDGIEKAILLANRIKADRPDDEIKITVDTETILHDSHKEYRFKSNKRLKHQLLIPAY